MDQLARKERNEERDFANEKLDWFILENKVRKFIQDLLEPIATISLENQGIIKQLQTNDLDHKTKIEKLETEYKSKSLKSVIRLDKPPVLYEQLQVQVNLNETRLIEFETQTNNELSKLNTKFNQAKIESSDLAKEIEEANKKISSNRLNFISESNTIKEMITLSIDEVKEEIQSQKFTISSVQECIKTINSQLIAHRDQLSTQENNLEKTHKKIEELLIQIEDIKSNIVIKSDYLKEIENLKEEVKHAMFSIEDIGKNLDATDNYLEKYFPVKMQELINEAFKYLAKTDEEREHILDYEVKKYKDFHKAVMKDEGESSLMKNGFKIPSIFELEKNLKELKIRNSIILEPSIPN